jgi:aminopeptidase N
MRVRRAAALATALLTLAVATPARAAGPLAIGASSLGDPVFPTLGNGGYDVQRYALDVTYDGMARVVRGTVRISARTTQPLSRFFLDAAGLDISAVLVDNVAAAFTVLPEKLQIDPTTPLRAGRAMLVEVRYSADPRRIPQPAGGFVPTLDGFATAAQPAAAHTVFPCNDHPSDKALFSFRVTAPPGEVGVANGVRTRLVTNPDGSTTATYNPPEPMATELVQLAVGTYTLLDHGVHNGVRWRDVVPLVRLPLVLPALYLTGGQLDWLTARLGPFPFSAYGLLPVDTDDAQPFEFTGLETQTLTLYRPDFLTQPENKIGGHMTHELTHSWFGDSVTPLTWADLWLNEGHAEYYALNYRYAQGWTDTKGFRTFDDRMRWTYAQGDAWRASSGPVAQPSAGTLFDNERYTGGTLVLYALAQRVGLPVFDRIERAFLAAHRYGNASTADYISTAVAVSGDPSVAPFLREWLYGTTTPPMPNHPDWIVDPVPPAPPPPPADLHSDRLSD